MANSNGKTASSGTTDRTAETNGCKAGGAKPTNQSFNATNIGSAVSIIVGNAPQPKQPWTSESSAQAWVAMASPRNSSTSDMNSAILAGLVLERRFDETPLQS